MRKLVCPCLIALGAVLIFGSWVSEKYFKVKWSSELKHQERIQNEILNETRQRSMWIIEYNKQITCNPQNPELLAQAAYSLSASNLSILGWVMAAPGKTFETNVLPILAKNWTIYNLETLLRSRKYDELVAITNQIQEKYEEPNSVKLVDDMMKAWLTAKSKEDEWNNIFIWFYICGSIFFATGWLSKTVSLLRTPDYSVQPLPRVAGKHRAR
jgi:hypothetical protein